MTMTETEARVFTIPAESVTRLDDNVAKLNAYAARLGLATKITTTIDYRTVTYKDDLGLDVEKIYADVTVHGDRVVLPGDFELAATLDLDPAGGEAIFRTNPFFTGPALPAEFRTVESTRCDHCNVRRYRKTTIVVHGAEDGFKVVGADCVKAYLGIDPAKVIPFLAELNDLFNEDGYDLGGAPKDPTVKTFLATAALVTLVEGFKPRSAEFAPYTVDTVWEMFGRKGDGFAKHHPGLVRPAAETVEAANALADAAKAWVATVGGNDYLDNLRIAAGRERVGRNGGLLASLPNAYKRAMAVEAERAERAKAPNLDAYLGDEGTKIEFTGNVVYTNRTEPYTYNGPDGLFVIIRTTEGATVHMFTTVATAVGEVLEDLDKETTVAIKATVKGHKVDRDGRKVTVITRAKVVG